MARKKSIGRRKVAEKAVKLLFAKSTESRINYLIDLLAEGMLDNETLDTILHGINEVGLGRGPVDERLLEYVKKTFRYRTKHLR